MGDSCNEYNLGADDLFSFGVIQYGHLVGHVTRHLPPLYYWLSATLSFLSRISNSINLLPNGQKTALFCVPHVPVQDILGFDAGTHPGKTVQAEA